MLYHHFIDNYIYNAVMVTKCKLYLYTSMLQTEILFYLCSVPEIISHLDYSSNFQFFNLYFLHEFLNQKINFI